MSAEKGIDGPDGIPAGPPVAVGPNHSIDSHVNAPSLDWSVPAPWSTEPLAQKKAEGTVASRVEKDEPKDPSRTDQIAQHTAGREKQSPVGQEKTKAARKPTKAKAAVAPGAVKPGRAPRKTTSGRAKPIEAQPLPAQPAQGILAYADTVQAHPAAPIPTPTPAAIGFLGNQDATPMDFIKLDPESRAFVEHHYERGQMLEAVSQSNMQWLDANARPVNSAVIKLVDALNKTHHASLPSLQVTAQPLGASYGPGTTAVQMGSIQVNAAPYEAPDLVAQAPDKAEKAMEQGARTEAQELENTVEPSRTRLMSTEQQPASDPQSPGPARRLYSAAKGRVARWAANLAPSTVLGPNEGNPLAGGKGNPTAGKGLAEMDRIRASSPEIAPASGAASVDLAKGAPAKASLVPDSVTKRFLRVEQDFFFADKTPAFSDRGDRLATRGAHPEVISSLIEIARARGWDNITVKGTEEFRRGAWMEAAQNGLRVIGYQPTPLDLAELANRPANNTVGQSVLKEKGPTPAQQQAAVQAADASPAKPTVALQGAPKTASAPEPPQPDPELAKKAKSFENDKPAYVMKKYPDLVGAYGILEAAKTFAAEKLPVASREDFVGLARRHVMQKIVEGQPVKGPQVYMDPGHDKQASEQTTTPEQGKTVNAGKSPPAKEVAKER